MHERSLPSLTSKGKGREGVQWNLGWWDFTHSLEGTRRPVQWGKSGVIYTGHEHQPLVLGRHFPTSRQFVLPSPPQITSTPSAYNPPSVVSVSSTDEWLFAYFPGRGTDGVGCLWRKGGQLDNWVVNECWRFAVGDGVVTASWTSSHREWIVSETGTSSRLPPLGPLTPLGTPLLLLVTHACEIYVCGLPPFTPTVTVTRASLLQPCTTDPPPPPLNELPGRIGGNMICTKAAIGLCYRDSTMLVAMRTQLMPSQSSTQTLHNLDLGLSIDVTQPPPDSPFLAEWELWGEECTISLCEVHVTYRYKIPPVVTHPLPPIYHRSSRLTDLVFFCPASSHANQTPGVKPEPNTAGTQNLYLTATFLDTGDYASLPKYEIVSYAFGSHNPLSGPSNSHWILQGETSRPGDDTKMPCFMLPSVGRGGLLAGFVDIRGMLPRRKQQSKETVIGTITVLKLPELTASEDWDSVSIHSHADHGNVDVPVSAALSPNEALLSCVASHFVSAQTSVQALPRRVSGGLASITASHLHGDLARQLVAAIRSRNSPSDIVHALSMPSLPAEVAVNTLHNTFAIMEGDSNGLMEMWTPELLGIATEVYSARARRLDRGPEKQLCTLRWHTAHELVSLKACCGAFSACQEGDAYDLDAAWQLVGLSGWIIELVEKLFKECILIGGSPEVTPSTPKERDLPDALSLDSPIFLHLAHPYALSRLQTALEHVKRFRDHVGKLTAKGENSHIAKDVLMDITDGSGVDLQLLGPLLADILQDARQLDSQYSCLLFLPARLTGLNMQRKTFEGAWPHVALPLP
ncbi:hypothetical protein C2E23DRAFT_375639 [Lenzites betulinus]|nr:hypothetical protein C2E23DRAFT_375639 [Lenzites betulinus]